MMDVRVVCCFMFRKTNNVKAERESGKKDETLVHLQKDISTMGLKLDKIQNELTSLESYGSNVVVKGEYERNEILLITQKEVDKTTVEVDAFHMEIKNKVFYGLKRPVNGKRQNGKSPLTTHPTWLSW